MLIYNEDWDAGIQSIVKVIQPDPPEPDSAEEYNERGNAYHEEGEYDLAIKDYNKAIELDPNYHAAYNSRGNAYKGPGEV